MKPTSIKLWLLPTVAALSLAAPAEAGEVGPAKGVQTSSKLDQQIDQAVGVAGASSSDIDSRIKDLDSTRAEIDEKKPPTVSLSVSGWVSQQALYYNAK